VQYFDKGRMELTTPGASVTSGLLVKEMISGRMQVGDTAFETRAPARISVAGDLDNLFPLYSDLTTPLPPQPLAGGAPVQTELTPNGPQAAANLPQDAAAAIATTDSATGFPVPRIFADFRDRVGVQVIGLAVTQPFWVQVKVAGVQRRVLMQAFERRVLTFTPSNQPAFQVEFGNIGQHYFQWRYSGGGASPAPSASASPSSPTPLAPPATSAPNLSALTLLSLATDGGTLSFTTDVPACGTVEYRLAGTDAWTTDITSISCIPGTSIMKTLTGLMPSTDYEVRGAAKDSAGNIGYSAISLLTTADMNVTPSIEKLVYSDLTLSFASSVSLEISFTTNQPACITAVEYRLHNTNGWTEGPSVGDCSQTSFTAVIQGLTLGTMYDVRMYGHAATGSVGYSRIRTFTTLGSSSTTAPKVDLLGLATGTGTITATYRVATTGRCYISYSSNSGGGNSSLATCTPGNTLTIQVTGLKSHTLYSIKIVEDADTGPVISSNTQQITTP